MKKREFKFRLWHTDEYPVVELRNTMAYQPDLSLDGAFDAHTYGNGVLMQFTGQLDMEGKDVYEGDIIETRHEDRFEKKGFALVYNGIAFRNGCFGIIGENTGELDCFGMVGDLKKDAKVVGNIYQNPELVNYLIDHDESLKWNDARFAHIHDEQPLFSERLTNWLDWQAAFIQMQQADSFIPSSMASTDWDHLRKSYFNDAIAVKEAFKLEYYEQ